MWRCYPQMIDSRGLHVNHVAAVSGDVCFLVLCRCVSADCDVKWFVMVLMVFPFAALIAPVYGLAAIANRTSPALRQVSALLRTIVGKVISC